MLSFRKRCRLQQPEKHEKGFYYEKPDRVSFME